MLKEEGVCKKHPTSARQVPRQNQKGGGKSTVGRGFAPSSSRAAPRRGTGGISFSPLSAFPSSSLPYPPTLFFLRWLDLYSFSSNVSGAYPPLSLRPSVSVSQASPSLLPNRRSPLSLRPQHPGLVCVHVALSWSASSHVFVREFPSAPHPLPQQPPPAAAPSRPPAWVGRGPWSERASACLSVYPQDDGAAAERGGTQ